MTDFNKVLEYISERALDTAKDEIRRNFRFPNNFPPSDFALKEEIDRKFPDYEISSSDRIALKRAWLSAYLDEFEGEPRGS